MDRQIRRLALVMLTLFALLLVQINYIQVFAAKSLVANPANATRLLISEYQVDRGEILARDGSTVLARSVPTQGQLKYLRTYPDGPLYADISGYYSFLYGTSQLEASQNLYLSGRAESLAPQSLMDQILGRPKMGASVITTIDPKLQAVATKALGGKPGAVAAIDPRTGEVLALVTAPSYDPNQLSSHDAQQIHATWTKLNKDPQKPLLSKADSELYPPGSSFKIVTAAAALQNGYGPDSVWPNPAALALPQTTHLLENFGGEHCLGGAPTLTLAQAFTVSCNVVFGQVGLKLGAEKMNAQAEAFGFNRQIPFEVPFAEGQFPPPAYFDQRQPNLAFAAIGQDEVKANPLQMALVASAVANGGVMMQPRLVSQVQDAQGRVISQTVPKPYGQPISPQTASELTQMMIDVVNNGTGTAAQIPGIQVAGKTGTAQQAVGAAPHAWFTAFAPADNPQIAVSVIVLDGGDLGSDATGGAVAAPIAKKIIEAALSRGAGKNN